MFNAAKVKGLTRRNSFSNGQAVAYTPQQEAGEAEYKQAEPSRVAVPAPHIVHGNINQIPLTKVVQVGTSGNVSIDMLTMKMNPLLNSIVTLRYSFIVSFDNDLLNAPPSQTRSLIMKSVNEFIFLYNVSGAGSWINGNNTSTFCNPVNGTRNILNPQVSTVVDADTGTLRISMNMIGVGHLYINGVIDVVANNREAIVNFS